MGKNNSANRLCADFKSFSADFAAWTDLTLCFDANETRWEVFDAISFLFQMYRQKQIIEKKKAGRKPFIYGISSDRKPYAGAWRIRISQYTGYGEEQAFVKSILDTIIGLDSFDKLWEYITTANDIHLRKDDDDAKELVEIVQGVSNSYEEIKCVLLSFEHDVFEGGCYVRTEYRV